MITLFQLSDHIYDIEMIRKKFEILKIFSNYVIIMTKWKFLLILLLLSLIFIYFWSLPETDITNHSNNQPGNRREREKGFQDPIKIKNGIGIEYPRNYRNITMENINNGKNKYHKREQPMRKDQQISLEIQAVIKNFSVINLQLFFDKLKSIADGHKTVYISSVDLSFVDMAVNLYEISLKKLKIRNHLFVCSHPLATEKLQSHGIEAVSLWNDTTFIGPSDYKTVGFGMKVMYKTIEITLALSQGYSVLILDVDIAIFQDPKPYLTCQNCDAIFQPESPTVVNSGFYISFPTAKSLQLHVGLIKYRICWKYRQQACLTKLLKKFNVSVKILNPTLFPNGQLYFSKGHRMFAGENRCGNCVMVHNNFIISFHAKRYRFKEHLLWAVNDDGYYSDINAKYITYNNNFYLNEDEIQIYEERALHNALIIGYILNRFVILPNFYCYISRHGIKRISDRPECAAQLHFNIKSLNTFLANQYREHMFLQNPLVPDYIKKSLSKFIYVNPHNGTKPEQASSTLGPTNQFLKPYDKHGSYNVGEFRNKIEPFCNFSVIRFHTLYGNLFDKNEIPIEVLINISKGVRNIH